MNLLLSSSKNTAKISERQDFRALAGQIFFQHFGNFEIHRLNWVGHCELQDRNTETASHQA